MEHCRFGRADYRSFWRRHIRHCPVWLAVVGAVLLHGPASGSDLSVCIDKSSPAAAMDHKLAEAVAKNQGVNLVVHTFDGSGGDDGFNLKQFKLLADTECHLILGFPVEASRENVPSGLMVTAPYGRIGFVLVTSRSIKGDSLATLPQATEVAVTYDTMPNLYFVDHPNIQASIFQTDAETIGTLMDHKVKAAMVWRPTAVNYIVNHRDAHDFAFHELNEPHAKWDLVALYDARGAASAILFDKGVSDLGVSGQINAVLDPYATPERNPVVLASADAAKLPVLTPVADTSAGSSPPALYTADQATAGKQKFADNCSQCHGDNLEGMAGPALKGKLFASPKAGYHVGDIFTIVSQNMPSTQPGSLAHDDYVQIMAFLLQQNGYPSGSTPLAFDTAAASKVPLIYNGN